MLPAFYFQALARCFERCAFTSLRTFNSVQSQHTPPGSDGPAPSMRPNGARRSGAPVDRLLQ